jgi:ABC-type cobalamin/Fe3+-siderophores transport system ATPase subunit
MGADLNEKIIFSADKASEDIKKYLTFSDGFEIGLNGNKSKIILGVNGVGKTSIFREIRCSDNSNQYIDYDTIKNDFIGKGKIIIIGAKIKIIEDKAEERESLVNKLDIKNKIKEKFSITTQGAAKAVSPYLEKLFKDKEQASALKDFSGDKFEKIGGLSSEQIDFLFKNISQVSAIKKTELEIKNIRDGFLEAALSNLERFLDDEKECPVCGTEKNETIKKIIARKKLSLVQLDNELIKKASTDSPQKDADAIRMFLHKIKETIEKNDITVDHIVNFVISGGDSNSMSDIVKKLAGLDDEIKKLEEEKKTFFNLLKTQENEIKDEFSKAFQSTKEIIFNEETNEIKIELDRKIETYSTGEINLMVFTVYMYEALASNKELIVIDDPLSSYDIINQYKIIYKIAFAHKSDKKLLVFTHNIDTINISNSQQGGLFEYQYIEKYGGKLYLQDIEPINENSFLKIASHLTTNDVKEGYIKLIIKRENSKDNTETDKVFHYDEPHSYTDKDEFTNDYLADLIDTFQGNFENSSFRENCINKIIYLTAIRVWVEKQFYNRHTNDKALHGKQFGEKVAYLFPEKKPQKWTGSSKVTRSFLMSKKVMLNQNTHTESQPIPFEYSLNLSLDNLANEIVEIKEAFSNLEQK